MGEGKPGEKGEKQYAEYFMPVNEHKKSLRGEKMYVNKSAEKTGGCRKAWFLHIVNLKLTSKLKRAKCRKACCWLFGIALLAGAITVAVLIGSKFLIFLDFCVF